MQFTDSHCHLDFIEFDSSRQQLIAACHDANIQRFIVPGITAKRWSRVLQLCQEYPCAKPCLGLHPWWIDKATPADLQRLQHYLSTEKVYAVGEIGIDGAIADIEKQSDYFAQQLEIANQFQLPVIIHHRKSHHLIRPLLKQSKPQHSGVIHAFSGNYQQAKVYLDLGFKLGIGGTISYQRAKTTRATVAKLPLESILLETDAPAMPLQGFQGEINSPLQINNVFTHLCRLRSEPAHQIAEQIENNVEQLFGFS